MRLLSNDAAPGPDTLLSSSQVMSEEIFSATRSPRSPQPPSIPPRNSLRQRTAVFGNEDDDRPPSPVIPSFRMQVVHAQSLQPLATAKAIAIDSDETINVDEKALGNSLSESPIMMPLSPVDIDDGDSSTASSPILNNSVSSSPTVSKRSHALLELLSSERGYASDLALIRDIHIPLALGSSSRAIPIASNSSGPSDAVLPMTKNDAKIIFNNVADLALFSDLFTERLEDSLGLVLEGGTGHDYVGALFLEMIPLLEPPYKRYITRHSTALEHLNSLTKTPALNAYLEHTRTLASSLTHVWDLPSLLIKPVQRLLDYPLLLTTIIEGTPDDHPDKPNLIKAKASMEEVARGVNEGRRRIEVIKEVLAGGKGIPDSGVPGLKPKKGLNPGVAASLRLGKVKGVRNAARFREGTDAGEEKDQVAKMEVELKRCEASIRKFARETVDWTRRMKHLMRSLYVWTDAFGQVIGILPDAASEAFDAFKTVLRAQIIPVCEDLEKVVMERFFPQLSLLADSMEDPSKLLEAMHTLEPLHYGLLNLDVPKSRPPSSLLEASQSYLALRGQLFTELPQYLALLHKGISAAIVQLSAWQTAFYKDTHAHWGELWDALRVEEDSSISSAPETVRIWWDRFSIVDEGLTGLGILRKPKVPSPLALTKTSTMSSSSSIKQTATPPPDIAAFALMPGSAVASAYAPQITGTSPSQPAQHMQYPHQTQRQSPPRSYSQSQTNVESHSTTQSRRKSGSVGNKVRGSMQSWDPVSPPQSTHTPNRDAQDGRKERRPSDVTVPPMESSQTYPRGSNNYPHSPPDSAQYHPQHHHSSRPPPLPHSNTQPIPSANLPARRPTHRARSHSRATIEEFQYLGGLIGDNSHIAAQAHPVGPGVLDANAPGLLRKPSPNGTADNYASRRNHLSQISSVISYDSIVAQTYPATPGLLDANAPGLIRRPYPNGTDNYASRRNHLSQISSVTTNAEDPDSVSEVVVLDKESKAEGKKGTREGAKLQRRGSVKKKLADTLENVARKSPSLPSVKRFSGPPGLGSPSSSPGLPQSLAQQQQQQVQHQEYGRSRSQSHSPPATPRPPAYPTLLPLTTTKSSNSSHPQGPDSVPVLYACEVVSPFYLARDVVYQGFGFHSLEVGMKLGIVQEFGHPSRHPALPVHVDDGEDCLLLAMDIHDNTGWAFASFLVPIY